MAAGYETLDPDSLIQIIPIVKDGANQVSHGVAFRMTIGEFAAFLYGTGALPVATPSVQGIVLQATTQAPAAAADVAALKTQFDALLTKLKTAGIMANA